MSSFFNVSSLAGNVFSTPVGLRIEQATDGTLASENWALNMEICDMINESSDTARDAMKAIRKRLSQNAGKNYTVIMYTLTVLESCVKNCGKAFHVLVSNKEFIQELVKLIGPKNDPPAVVQEKVLNLIQTWADTFRSQPDLNGVVQVYQELKSKGIEFPVTDLDSVAPIYTPQRSVPEGVSASPPTGLSQSPRNHPEATHAAVMIGPNAVAAAGVVAGSVELKPERVNKIQSELDVVTMNMSILSEMLSTLKPGQEDPADYKLLVDLYHTCKEMQQRIVELIGRVNNDEITAELLRLNDELNNMFLRYQRYEKNRDPKNASTPSTILGAALGVPGTQQRDSLIDLGANDSGLSTKFSNINVSETASAQLSQIDSVNAQSGSSSKQIDEFDMLAQSRKEATETPSKKSADKKPEVISMANANESELDEMAAWLNTADAKGPEDSLTSTEFEKFLAERAAAAENLPNVSGTTNSSQPKKPSKKDEDNLMAL